MSYGPDKWCAPITVSSTTNKFRVNETGTGGAGEVIVTIAAGTYYLHSSANSDYPGLYKAIDNAITVSGAVNAYDFKVATPTLSTGLVGGGLRFGESAATIEFEVDFSDADFTMDPRWFGFAADTGVVTATQVPDTTYVIDSPLSVYGQWLSFSEFGGLADDKRSRPKNNSRKSHERSRDAYVVTWNRDNIRTISYPHVSAAHVYADRVGGDVDSDIYAEVGRLHPTDNHNAFETIWDLGLRKLEPVLIIHDNGHKTIKLDGSWDAVLLDDESYIQDFDRCLTSLSRGGEYYEVNPGPLFLAHKGYNH